jgi:murein DD-endopeptidase MepM/ murein hydrolase activator NlpD
MKKLSMLLVCISVTTFSFASTHHHRTGKSHKKAISRSLDFPVAGKRSSLGDGWGASREGGIRKHKGIDIHAHKGTPVVAIADGRIVGRHITPIGGKTLWLKPAHNSWTAYYAHLDKQLVKEGQTVHKGQVIGTVGNTGNARTTPSHLHFGVKTKGHWVNPLPYVKNAGKVTASVSSHKKSVVHSHRIHSK